MAAEVEGAGLAPLPWRAAIDSCTGGHDLSYVTRRVRHVRHFKSDSITNKGNARVDSLTDRTWSRRIAVRLDHKSRCIAPRNGYEEPKPI